MNILKTGNLLQEMAFVGDSLSTPRVQDAIDYIERHWDDLGSEPGWRLDPSWCHKQAMFTAMKGFAAFAITYITVERGGTPTTVDWFDEMVTALIAEQNADGSWTGDYWASNPIASTWALLVLEKAAPQIFYAIESCNSLGVKKDNFDPSETVYAKGSGYTPSTDYNIYIVNDVSAWTDGMDIPARVPGTATTVASDADGNIPPTAVWCGPLSVGMYDIVVDANGNGKYDANEPLDNNDVVTAGFLVIPEFWLGAILGLAGCFAAFGVFNISKRRRY